MWYLPSPLSRPLAPTVDRAGRGAEPGHHRRDRRRGRRRGGAPPCRRRHRQSTSVHPSSRLRPSADVIVSVSDADEEVRHVVRAVFGLASEGMALDRVGVFYPVATPYLALLEQQLAAAGIPANGPSRPRLAETAAGRTLLGALELPAQHWRRDRVLAVLSEAPLRDGAGPVRPVVWNGSRGRWGRRRPRRLGCQADQLRAMARRPG